MILLRYIEEPKHSEDEHMIDSETRKAFVAAGHHDLETVKTCQSNSGVAKPMRAGEGAERISCSSDAPKDLRTHFPSNIIDLQKGKVPQFFAKGWKVNCDYLEKGVKARKASNLTPIKPVPRAVPLTRLF
jgi:hypothetical protein